MACLREAPEVTLSKCAEKREQQTVQKINVHYSVGFQKITTFEIIETLNHSLVDLQFVSTKKTIAIL